MSNLLGQLMALDDSYTKRARKEAVRCPFGYPGSKERSLTNLLPLIEYRDSYVEECGGSGAVLLARNESKLEVFNDRHSGITAFYKCIADKKNCQELAERIKIVLHSREYFEWCAETWETMNDDVERAARWFAMVSFSFNQKGWQFGRSLKPPGFLGSKVRNSIDHFDPLNHRLRNTQIENLDWRICMDDFDSAGTVHYIDPPYWGVPRTYDFHWTEADHIELCERAMRAEGFVAISGYDCPEHPYNRYKWDDKASWEVPVSAIGLAFHETNNMKQYEGMVARGTAIETLWIKKR